MRGYDRNGICYERGGKSGEHGQDCSWGHELTMEYVAIELEHEERRRKYRENYVRTHRRHCFHCGYEGDYTDSCACPECGKFCDVIETKEAK